MDDGVEVPFDDYYQALVNDANDSLGALGERVLAFAKYTLEPEFYPKGY